MAHTDKDVRVFAFQNIATGEQLYISYNECEDEDCEGLKYKYITPNILEDYGFVEQYPRRFWLEEERELLTEVDIEELQRNRAKN